MQNLAIGMFHRPCFVVGLAILGCSCARLDATEQRPRFQGSQPSPLPQQSAVSYPPEAVTRPAEIQKAVSYFDEQSIGFGQRVRTCGEVVRIQVGKDSLIYGRGLAAYGAHCTLGNGRGVVMCYEEAGGRFTVVSGSFSIDRLWVTAFTSRNCADNP